MALESFGLTRVDQSLPVSGPAVFAVARSRKTSEQPPFDWCVNSPEHTDELAPALVLEKCRLR